jgi:hypothetical protein
LLATRWLPHALDVPQAAALVFAIVTLVAMAFQVALALGAPWGEYAMGGANRGKLPPAMRVAAVVQALVLAVLVLVVLTRAGLVDVPIVHDLPWLIWVAVAFSAVSLVLNAISRSARERQLWVPIALLMLGSSLLVALTAGP